jgi:hypothetical protein
MGGEGLCPVGELSPRGPGHHEINLAGTALTRPLPSLENRGVGAIPGSHLRCVGLDMMLAGFAPDDQADLGRGGRSPPLCVTPKRRGSCGGGSSCRKRPLKTSKIKTVAVLRVHRGEGGALAHSISARHLTETTARPRAPYALQSDTQI